MKNFYYVLGIDINCMPDEIRDAYRKLAKKFHPDLNPGDAYFESRFKEIIEAYEVLSDPKKRVRYDAALKAFQSDPAYTKQTIQKSPTRGIDIGFTLILISITIVFGIYVMSAIHNTKTNKLIKAVTVSNTDFSAPKHHKKKHKTIGNTADFYPPVSTIKPQPELPRAAPDTNKASKPAYLYVTTLRSNITGVVHMHQADDLGSATIKTIPGNSQVYVLQKGDNFYKVQYDNNIGYVPKWTLQIK